MKLQTRMESPQSLVDAIEQFVQARTSGMIRSLHVEVADGQVVISGRTSTYYTKQLATHAVLNTMGEISLVNDIEVC